MKRDELGLIVAGFATATALFACWLGHWVVAFVFVALCGGALAVAGEGGK